MEADNGREEGGWAFILRPKAFKLISPTNIPIPLLMAINYTYIEKVLQYVPVALFGPLWPLEVTKLFAELSFLISGI